MTINKEIRIFLSILIAGVIITFVFNFKSLGVNKHVSNRCEKEKFKAVLIEKKKTNRAYILKLKKRDGAFFEPRCGVSEELFYKISIGDSLIKIKEGHECFIKTKENERIELKYINEW